MARLSEPIESRVGSTKGIHGSYEPIVLDIIAEEGDYTVQDDGTRKYDDPKEMAKAFCPEFSMHPWNDRMVATQYTMLDHLGVGHFVVRVDYDPIGLVIPPEVSRGWEYSFRSTTVTETVWEEPPEFAPPGSDVRPGGIGRLNRLTSESLPSENPDGEARIIGTTIFQPAYAVSAGFVAQYYASIPQADGTEKRQPLMPTGRVEPVPQTIERPAIELALTRVQPNCSLLNLPQLAVYDKAVNAAPWWNAEPRHVLCGGIEAHPVDRDMVGQVVAGTAWQVSLSLLWSSRAWSPINLVPLWHDAAGERYIVYEASGKKVVESFRRKAEVHFDTLFGILNA